MTTINNSPVTTRTTIGLSAALAEAAEQHHAAEKRLPKHDWNDWYAAFIKGREAGETIAQAAAVADTSVSLKLVSQAKEARERPAAELKLVQDLADDHEANRFY